MTEMLLGMFVGLLSTLFLFCGFAYLVWVFAGKESGGVKTLGKTVSLLLVIFAVLSFLLGIYGGISRALMYSQRSRQSQMMPPRTMQGQKATQPKTK